jgi:hypothetical protein
LSKIVAPEPHFPSYDRGALRNGSMWNAFKHISERGRPEGSD